MQIYEADSCLYYFLVYLRLFSLRLLMRLDAHLFKITVETPDPSRPPSTRSRESESTVGVHYKVVIILPTEPCVLRTFGHDVKLNTCAQSVPEKFRDRLRAEENSQAEPLTSYPMRKPKLRPPPCPASREQKQNHSPPAPPICLRRHTIDSGNQVYG